MVKIPRRILALLVLTCLPALLCTAKDLPWQTPTTITGSLSLDKEGGIRISSGDIVVRSESTKYPVKNIPVEGNDAPARYAEVKKLAEQGQKASLRGEFETGTSPSKLRSYTPTYSFN